MVSPVGALSSFPSVSTVGATRAAGAAATAGAGADFGRIFAETATQAIDTVKAGEAAAITGIEGQTSTQEVVRAIMSAEQTLQAALAIRDKVVAAYQEISRMQI